VIGVAAVDAAQVVVLLGDQFGDGRLDE